jgi:hypothetical protein
MGYFGDDSEAQANMCEPGHPGICFKSEPSETYCFSNFFTAQILNKDSYSKSITSSSTMPFPIILRIIKPKMSDLD